MNNSEDWKRGFWGGERIKRHLEYLVTNPENGTKGDPDNIDCAAFTLTMGPEVYITRTAAATDPKGHTKIRLQAGEHFELPAGQFAFLLTEESVRLPADVMGLISIKAKWKFKGLVNVSGFHVDPGYHGRLVFSVFNAGPAPITLCRGQKLFLIWFADLIDNLSEYSKHSNGEENLTLKPELINQLSGSVYSPMVLIQRIEETRAHVDNQIHKLYLYLGGLFIAVLVSLIAVAFQGVLFPDKGANSTSPSLEQSGSKQK